FSESVLNSMRNASLEDDINDPFTLYSLQNPESLPPILNSLDRLSIDIFLGLSGGSQKMYKNVRDALERHDQKLKLLSHYCVEKLIARETGVFQLYHDMCPNGCTAYTGEYSEKDTCPKCSEPRYVAGKNGKAESQKQFTTIPLGPQIQA
ncbi:hypothetical protein BDN72DRAFT_729529, partial [Pluteus cervinus]